ncbi:MAG TPA: DUF2442 domain-containing protein [Candidatus Ozemobacteraceae bacterium]|nr:DUF2442 domain-containing protein [Candidatus Ozemobacteraceae bacterium]HOY66628.1 DUF2442 domain-containing protein [Candidatus Ozemobacteraceae bacterium]
MALMKRPRLTAIKAMPNFKMRLTFLNGATYVVDFLPLFEESKGLAPLRNQKAFADAMMDEWGWEIEWPAFDIQIGADTLWMDAQAQAAKDPATRDFIMWRARNGLSLADAARALGITSRTVSAYGTGERPVPLYITLACKGWEAERQPGHKKAA